MALRHQNNPHTTNQVPGYYANNKLYKDAYTRTDWQTRVSRRIHDGFNLQVNYGLDTTSDDVNSSPYSSPYYVNGRYNSDNLVTQRANSASVQGTKFLISKYDEQDSTTQVLLRNPSTSNPDEATQTTITLWQGKQIKFALPYTGKIVGNTIRLRNTGSCTGILSVYLSATDNGRPLMETAIDLCKVSTDKFESFELRGITPVSADANPRGTIYVRMEIWDEISNERSANPFNTGRKIEIAATGLGNHDECIYELNDKNVPIVDNDYTYSRMPSRPLIGFTYNSWHSVPVDRVGNEKTGATVTDSGYRYDIFCINNGTQSEMLIYDKEMNKLIDNTIRVDGRAEAIQIAQVVDQDRNNWVYYVDGYSPLQKFKIGQWTSSLVEDTGPNPQNPVLGPSFIIHHNNRLYIGGFLNDKSLWQCTTIDGSGPNYTRFAYRFYTPNASPYLNSTNPPTAVVEFSSDEIMIIGKNFYSLFRTNVNLEDGGTGSGVPRQVSSWTDSVGVQSQGDIVNYKGNLYSFDEKEGIRRFSGGLWQRIPNAVDSHFDRVDLSKPRKIWGYANKLYFNYYDKIDGKAKCLIWDQQMNYQQYPWFQDVDLPFCDARFDETEFLVGIHPDYPCIMHLYAVDTWRRLDSPIVFERHSKYLSVPGNSGSLICKRIHNKVLANCNRWWWFGVSIDKHSLEQHRGSEPWYRMPCWDTITDGEPAEYPFPEEDVYEENAIARLDISNVRIKAEAIQERVKCKTFRAQANLVSVEFEVQVRQYN